MASTTQTVEGAGISALAAIPVVGSFLAPIASIVTNFLGAAHQAAVIKEASTINNALPVFVQTIQQIMQAANSGEFTPTQTLRYLQQAQSNYYSAVASIIKKGAPCAGNCQIGTESAAGKPP